jgi:hypothetical protein
MPIIRPRHEPWRERDAGGGGRRKSVFIFISLREMGALR